MVVEKEIEKICSKYFDSGTVDDCDKCRKLVDELYGFICSNFLSRNQIDKIINDVFKKP